MLDYLHLPASTIANKIITKNIFDMVEISNSDKKILTKDVSRIVWEYRIAPDNTNIRPICNDKIDYSEIQVIRVQLKQRIHLTSITNLIMSSFQYPLLLVFEESNESMFVAAQVRINQTDRSKIVVEDVVKTDWITEEQIGDDLNISKMKTTNIFDLYTDIFNSVMKLRVKCRTKIIEDLSPDEYKLIDRMISQIDEKISKLKLMLKNEDQFNTQMELNDEILALQKYEDVCIKNITTNHAR